MGKELDYAALTGADAKSEFFSSVFSPFPFLPLAMPRPWTPKRRLAIESDLSCPHQVRAGAPTRTGTATTASTARIWATSTCSAARPSARSWPCTTNRSR